jgi:hypothetical protein
MIKKFFRLDANVLLILSLTLMLVGCRPPSPDSRTVIPYPSSTLLPIPSKSPFIVISTPNSATSTPRDAITQTAEPSQLCERVPEPKVGKPDNSNNIYLSGKAYLCSYRAQTSFDFDSGTVGTIETTTTDVILKVGITDLEHRSLYYLWETNNAYVDVSDLEAPDEKYCEQLTSAPNRLGFVLREIGATGCVLTNEGRLAFFHVEQVDSFGLGSIELSFVIWDKK